MKTIKVELGARSYEITVGEGLIDSADQYLEGTPGKIVVVADETVDGIHGKRLARALSRRAEVHKVLVPSSETAKSWDRAGEVLSRLAELKVRRNDLVVTFGGGVASDLGGFVASVYQRGVPLIHFPTTLLGQVDAAIGGKTGVNLPAGKNLAGTFYQPSAVLADVSVLKTLPSRQFRSGMAEVVKYGLCYEAGILDVVREQAAAILAHDPAVLEDLVGRCAGIKARVVSQDETDHSGRMILNYGHTFGHALEAAGNYELWLHGEAISLGMMFAAHLAKAMGLLDDEAVEVHREAFDAMGLPVKGRFDANEVVSAWSIDKKFQDGQRWVLLEGLQNPVVRSDVTPVHIEEALPAVSLSSPTRGGL
ncbi:MAG TPA: 3-dehydroquinate synthase [Actinomycetota bacterium]|nr:3-dehydroquinate synthase [Actinomycetota bacterium]